MAIPFSKFRRPFTSISTTTAISTLLRRRTHSTTTTTASPPPSHSPLDVSSQVGSILPLSHLRIGTTIHSLEFRPNQGPKLVRAAGTTAKILKNPTTSRYVLIRLPSGVEKLINIKCRAVVGTVSSPGHKVKKKLRKAGENRWRGIRPKVRGVAMNPIDHPHGGGEGKSKGRCSVTPWGKPTKGGYKTASPKKKKRLYVH
ncbi:hypothetical protein Drorol1_Dr00012763 [Drosera rotundifolia]